MAETRTLSDSEVRRALLVKREKNRKGESPYRLNDKQQKVEDDCNKKIRDINIRIGSCAGGPLS